ncbi:unnamed protein product [Peniophora sp. CBMAI 1063]|nr:unnamed protein product [Peniophora sp. CBMAI 1063]
MALHADYAAAPSHADERGHPIVNAQPGMGSDGLALRPIEVGDVGYISHIDDDFIRIFDVHLEPGMHGTSPAWGSSGDPLTTIALQPSPSESRSSSSTSDGYRRSPCFLTIPSVSSTAGAEHLQPGLTLAQPRRPVLTLPTSPSSPTASASDTSPTEMKHRRGISGPTSPTDYECVRMKKKHYAKTFRDNEKHYFEELGRRLFPTDPNVRRAECLQRAVAALDELETYKAREDQRDAEIELLREELTRANMRTRELEQVVAQPQTGVGLKLDASQGFKSHHGHWL